MIKVGMIFCDNLSVKNGMTFVVEQFLLNAELFKENNIKIGNLYTSKHIYTKEDLELLESKPRPPRKIEGTKRKNIKKIVINSRFLTSLFIYISRFRSSKKAVKKYLSHKQNDDLILFNNIIDAYYYYKFLKNKKNNPKCILTLHSNGTTYSQLFKSYPKLKKTIMEKKLIEIENIVLNKVEIINFVSKISKDNFDKNNIDISKKTYYIHNGVPDIYIEAPKKKRDIVKILTVGSVCYRKGHDIIIDCVAQLPQEVRNKFKIYFVGKGPNYEEYMENVKNLDLNECIYFLGARDDINELLHDSDAFLLASRDEGLPIAIIEALSAGLPIYATDVGGNRELIKENGMLLFPSIESVEKAIKSILKDDLEGLGFNSRELYFSGFTINAMIFNYIKLFKRLVNEE